jgi:hypothetical protein
MEPREVRKIRRVHGPMLGCGKRELRLIGKPPSGSFSHREDGQAIVAQGTDEATVHKIFIEIERERALREIRFASPAIRVLCREFVIQALLRF